MREELRQIFQTGVKNKQGNDVNDSHPSLSAERGSSGRARVQAAGLRPRLGSGGCHRALVDYLFGKCPHVLVSFFFFLSVYRVISDCK